MEDWLGLAGKSVVVVGAGGLGTPIALGFVAAGAHVLVADRDETRLAQLAEDPAFSAAGGEVLAIDLSGADAAQATIDTALAATGRLDVLVLCIGINNRKPILDISVEEWNRVIEVNLSIGFRVAQAAGVSMRKQGSGRIIFLSSVSGLLAHKNHGPYAASKGGTNQLMRVMAAEWAADGITVNAIAPGYVETPLTKDYLERPGVREGLTSLVPAGRLGKPEEVVGPALFLASEPASFVTGHVLYVDGGRTLV
jgi:NAD(P)-dependent dehydrogenase (short-subunit alcohol dehydrogenase family)